MHKPFKTVSASLLTAAILGIPMFVAPLEAQAEASIVQQQGVVKGTVKDSNGEPAIGASVVVVGTKNITTTDLNGNFSLKNVAPGATIRFSLIGFERQDIKWNGGPLDVVMQDAGNSLNEVVVTAMGIARKEKSLTYATQQIKNDEFMKVQDPNVINSIEGKVSGVTITPGAGGAGGSSKILLRGNKSILGNNAPLIVIDGIPMTNNTRGQVSDAQSLTYSSSSEGSDPLSMINPDDIESMNILKGANAAALYGSAAANGVVMITTKKGKEGRMDVNFTSNVTFSNPLLTPKIQNIYGADINANGGLELNSWGKRMEGVGSYTVDVPVDNKFGGGKRAIYLRNQAKDDVDEFYRMGYTTNNSISLSGGTEKMRSYFSYSNSYASGMVDKNTYNRNTFAFRQSFKLFDRVTIDANANYVQTTTKNRVSGGTVGNPIYDLYMMPRNIDLDHYKHDYSAKGTWMSAEQGYYKKEGAGYVWAVGQAQLEGPLQQWAYQTAGRNNPYWLLNMNNKTVKEDRFYGSVQGRLDIYDGLSFQARVSLDHSRYNGESKTYATTWGPTQMNDYGTYWASNDRTNEIYTDYLLSYNKNIKDFSVSATAGWVGHVIKGNSFSTYTSASVKIPMMDKIPSIPNYFDPKAAAEGESSKSKSSNWDKAALVTAQIGWKDAIFVDASYRRDWYRAFRQAQFTKKGTNDNYGYFGFGANAILSQLIKMPEWVSYVKYRLSYSEVGNSIPNVLYGMLTVDYVNGVMTPSQYNSFNPIPEKTKSFETGFETQFFNNRLNFDITYYNSSMHNSYLVIPGLNGKSQPVNTGVIRNQGIELTLGYDWRFAAGWRWKTSANFSYNINEIEKTYTNEKGQETLIATSVANGKVQVRYKAGGKYGDMYVTDFTRWENDVYNDNGVLNQECRGELVHKKGDIFLNDNGTPSIDGNFRYIKDGKIKTKKGEKFGRYIGNMNSKIQLGWSNTISYKDFSLYFLINGRIGGKVISLTEAYLDNQGLSQRTAAARAHAEANKIYFTDKNGNQQLGMYVPDGSGQIAPIRGWYETVGSNDASSYVYNATNFRLRELSLGYTFRDLLGDNKNLTLSVIGRNLFFIYKDAPVDPDVSLSSANGLGAFEVFNLPSERSFGINLKLNF